LWFGRDRNGCMNFTLLLIAYDQLVLIFPSEAVVERVFKLAKRFDAPHRTYTPQHLALRVMTTANMHLLSTAPSV